MAKNSPLARLGNRREITPKRRGGVCSKTNSPLIGGGIVLHSWYFWVEAKSTLGVDGWTNAVTIPILGFSINHHFVKCVETRGQPHTAKNVAEEVIKTIDFLEGELHITIVGCVTDAASNMVSMRSLVKEVKPGLVGL